MGLREVERPVVWHANKKKKKKKRIRCSVRACCEKTFKKLESILENAVGPLTNVTPTFRSYLPNKQFSI